MEDITRLVDDSMARHGFDVSLDHRRLLWSRWFRCESGFSLAAGAERRGNLHAWPKKWSRRARWLHRRQAHVGGFPDQRDRRSVRRAQPALRSWQPSAGASCFRTLLCALRHRGRPGQRKAACKALNQWLATSAETATGIVKRFRPPTGPAPRQAGKHPRCPRPTAAPRHCPPVSSLSREQEPMLALPSLAALCAARDACVC